MEEIKATIVGSFYGDTSLDQETNMKGCSGTDIPTKYMVLALVFAWKMVLLKKVWFFNTYTVILPWNV